MNIQQNLMERKRFTNIILIILHIALKFSRKIGSDPPTTQTIKHKGGGSNVPTFWILPWGNTIPSSLPSELGGGAEGGRAGKGQRSFPTIREEAKGKRWKY